MLVLSRKHQESVVIGGSDAFHRLLKVTVLGIKGSSVKLGFEVDPDIPVHRSEVWERINGNGRAGGMAGRLGGVGWRDARGRVRSAAKMRIPVCSACLKET